MDVIYLDNAATSFPKPPEVERAMVEQLRQCGNPGRGGHRLAALAERTLEQARVALDRLLDGIDPRRFVLTLNGTDALHLAIRGVLDAVPGGRAGEGRAHVVTTLLEHNSVMRPLRLLETQGQIDLEVVPCGPGGVLDAEGVAQAVRPDTALIAFTLISNALGTVQPAEAIVERVRARSRALILVDAAQAVGTRPLSLHRLGADLVAFPGHKGLMGPTGTGALWVGPGAQPQVESDEGARIACVRTGGTGDSREPRMPPDLPRRLEGGTPNVVGIAGLAAGVAWVHAQGVESIARRERDVADRLRSGLRSTRDVNLVGAAETGAQSGVVSFTIEGHDPAEVAAVLDAAFGIAVRPGLHCAPGAHEAAGTLPHGTIRASVGPFTSSGHIDALVGAIESIVAETGPLV